MSPNAYIYPQLTPSAPPQDNCKKYVKNKDKNQSVVDDGMFWQIQGSRSEEEFLCNIESMKSERRPNAAEYLSTVQDGEWLLYKWVENRGVT